MIQVNSIHLLGNGFLPTRGSVMLDLVFVVMGAVLVCLTISIVLARYWKQFRFHRTIQVVLTVLLSVAILLFEVDMRFFTNWRELAKPSPYYESGVVSTSLVIHLVFAIPTPFVWAYVIWKALTSIRWAGDDYRQRHRFWGRVAAGAMVMTTVTGWCFYWLAFVAS